MLLPAPVVDCQQYTPGIVYMQKQEKALIREANHTSKNGNLMVIISKYRHINSKLGGAIQDQQDCYILNKEGAKTDKHWAQYHFNGWPGSKGGW